VPPLGTPPDEALRHGAVALFVQHALASDRHFGLSNANADSVITLCRRLDGLPLAIKLAASRLSALGLDEISSRVNDSLRLLRAPHRHAPCKQQTMEAALDWSHGLLSQFEQTVFRRLAVFVGGFSLQSAIEVARNEGDDEWCVIDVLQSLVERSLIDVSTSGSAPARYRLPECTGHYAMLKLLQSEELDQQRRAHARACLSIVESAYQACWEAPDEQWLHRYAPDLDNIRMAIDWCAAHDPPMAVRLIGAATPLFTHMGLAQEARRCHAELETVAINQQQQPAPAWLPRYWLERAQLEVDFAPALMLRFARTALEQYRCADNPCGVYLALRCAASASSLLNLGGAQLMRDEMVSLEQTSRDVHQCAQRLFALASSHSVPQHSLC
jgi:predicted ATPase